MQLDMSVTACGNVRIVPSEYQLSPSDHFRPKWPRCPSWDDTSSAASVSTGQVEPSKSVAECIEIRAVPSDYPIPSPSAPLRLSLVAQVWSVLHVRSRWHLLLSKVGLEDEQRDSRGRVGSRRSAGVWGSRCATAWLATVAGSRGLDDAHTVPKGVHGLQGTACELCQGREQAPRTGGK